MAEFLFEIGFEEMPAPWLSGLADQLRAKFTGLATDEQLAPSVVRVLWTSRRLVLVAEVKTRQDDRTAVEWGPAAKVAKDAAGNWSKAAEGFAKKQGVGLEAMTLAPKVDGSADLYVSARKHIAGRATLDVLAGMLPSILRGFNFAKRMNWDAWLDDGRGAFEFGRPIQWLVALLDGEVVPLTIFDVVAGAKGAPRVVSGRRSTGSRFYPRGAADRGFDVRSFAELDAGLSSRFVILDPKQRAGRVKAQVEKAGGKAAGESANLIAEWCDLVEYPTLAIGTIPKEFADLPREVLETVLAHHQKAITLPPSADGAPRFAAISGCDEAGAANAARGQERVVVARLKDARFFWNEDRKRPLADRVAELGKVTFYRGLGTYLEKAEWVARIAGLLSQSTTLAPTVVAAAQRASRLAKADLVTLMVREFPELQGLVGGLYAEGTETALVAGAIRRHYLPNSIDPSSPPQGFSSPEERNVFAIVSLADKLDTLIAYFIEGQVPTGSADPFGLRRVAQGIIRVLLDFWPTEVPTPNLDLLIGNPIELLPLPDQSLQNADFALLLRPYFHSMPGVFPRGDQLRNPENMERVSLQLRAFLADRLRHAFVSRGTGRADEIEAVLTVDTTALRDVRETEGRVKALSRVRSEQPDVFAAMAESFKRAKNIVANAKVPPLLPANFVEDAERHLFAAITRAEATPESDHVGRLRAVAALRGEVDAFFKSVMVMSDDPALKANRLALLSRLLNLVYEVADLSKLASPAGEKTSSS